MVYVWATLLLIFNMTAWLSTLLTLPGNWLLVLFTGIYVFFLPADMEPRISWTVAIVVLVLAILGEIVEFFAGAHGAAKQGGSRRGIVLAILGAIIGSMTGAIVSMPIPIIGPLIGALVGGAIGSFAGAWVGEHGTGRTSAERYAIGQGAMMGRLLGTAGKLVIGVIMLLLVTMDSFFDFATKM
ncbi:DUF456 domain-containing protein [Rubinisphaera italica]|uniref:DUF456 domain-containing protein n=1 Tax=Rubinisphaera italica TaxID=2527969 RepID=A0A5C5XNK0_9PLAN|nr:DUF456 domain-containing protein [Rubinisphaera italica]TWT64061.1 hypothetical protein Pan54_48220 [Rubinisphaera italica]